MAVPRGSIVLEGRGERRIRHAPRAFCLPVLVGSSPCGGTVFPARWDSRPTALGKLSHGDGTNASRPMSLQLFGGRWESAFCFYLC